MDTSFFVANWKSHKTETEAKEFLDEFSKSIFSPDKIITGYYAQDINNITGKKYKEYLANLAEQIRLQIPKGSTLFFFANNRFRKVIKLLGSDYVIEEPMAAAIGAKLPIQDSSGSFI